MRAPVATRMVQSMRRNQGMGTRVLRANRVARAGMSLLSRAEPATDLHCLSGNVADW